MFPAKGSGYPASLPASTFLAFFNVGFDTGVKQLAADPNKAYFIAASDSGGPAFGESFWFAWAPVTANDPTAVEVVVKKCP